MLREGEEELPVNLMDGTASRTSSAFTLLSHGNVENLSIFLEVRLDPLGNEGVFRLETRTEMGSLHGAVTRGFWLFLEELCGKIMNPVGGKEIEKVNNSCKLALPQPPPHYLPREAKDSSATSVIILLPTAATRCNLPHIRLLPTQILTRPSITSLTPSSRD